MSNYHVWSRPNDLSDWIEVNEGTRQDCDAFIRVRLDPEAHVQIRGLTYIALRCGQHPAQVYEQHRFHSWCEYPEICELCRIDKQQAADDREADWAAAFNFWFESLDTGVSRGTKEVNAALDALSKLFSNEVYDEELMGVHGSDLQAELDTAARALRNATRLVAWRKAILKPQPLAGGLIIDPGTDPLA